jgi:protocatechuate 3,4-dioxygenase beta subunit
MRATGPGGSTVFTTDTNGIYDIAGLPPGHYTIELAQPDWHPVNTYDLADGEIGEDHFHFE